MRLSSRSATHSSLTGYTSSRSSTSSGKQLVAGKKKGDDTVKKSSLHSVLRTRASERESLTSLPFTILYFIVYIMGIMNHQDVRTVYLVESSMREFLEDYTFGAGARHTLHTIKETKDFWLFMRDALLPALCVQTDHLGNTLQKEDWGRVLSKNRLKGGILLEQFRTREFARDNYLEQFRTPDYLYFPGEGTVLPKDVPGNKNGAESRMLLQDFLAFGNMEGSDADDRQLRRTSDNSSISGNSSLDQNKTKQSFVGSFASDESTEAAELMYPFFLFEQEPMDILQKRVQYLENINWIDQYTTQLNIKVLFLNDDVELIQHLKIRFLFPNSGSIFSKMYFQSSYTNAYKTAIVLVFDIVWLLLLIKVFLQALKDAFQAFRKGKIGMYCKNVWNITDWASIVFGFVIIGMFALERNMVETLGDQLNTAGGNINQDYWGSMLKLHIDAEVLSNMGMWFRLLQANYTMIILMRFFKAFKGQARLAIVTNTIVHASSDLFHFVIVFLSAFLTYTFAGTVLFGRRIQGFSTFPEVLRNMLRYCLWRLRLDSTVTGACVDNNHMVLELYDPGLHDYVEHGLSYSDGRVH